MTVVRGGRLPLAGGDAQGHQQRDCDNSQTVRKKSWSAAHSVFPPVAMRRLLL